MRCTNCSTDIKPVVAIDIDGTLGDYHTHFTDFASRYVGHWLPNTYRGQCEFSEYLKLDKGEYRDIKLAYRQGGQKRSMPIYAGAAEFMRHLREMGCEVWIATTRPWLRLDNIDPDTRHWLDRHGILYDYILYGDDKIEQLLSRVDQDRVIGVIDDLAEQCVLATLSLADSPHGMVEQVARPHNTEDMFYPRIKGFDSLEINILENKRDWEEHNGG